MSHRPIVGLDLSLTSTGVAIIEPGKPARTTTVKSSGTLKDTYDQRIARLADLTDRTVNLVPERALVVIEGPSYGSAEATRSMWDRAGHWHMIAGRLAAGGCLIAVPSPKTVKKWATGSGNADKVAVALAMARLFPEVEAANSDEADALACALMGANRLGVGTFSASRTKQLEKVAWPDSLPELDIAAA